jgi:hypothetical protein
MRPWYREVARTHSKRLNKRQLCPCGTCELDRAIRTIHKLETWPACIALSLDVVAARRARAIDGRMLCVKQAILLIRVYALLSARERRSFALPVHAAVQRALALLECFTR